MSTAKQVSTSRMRRQRTIVTAFKIVAFAEAASWLGLLIGMFFKYGPTGNEIGVKVFGPIHGAIFVAYLLVALLCIRPLRWGFWTRALALAASIPPFATLLFEWWANRTGRLAVETRVDIRQTESVPTSQLST